LTRVSFERTSGDFFPFPPTYPTSLLGDFVLFLYLPSFPPRSWELFPVPLGWYFDVLAASTASGLRVYCVNFFPAPFSFCNALARLFVLGFFRSLSLTVRGKIDFPFSPHPQPFPQSPTTVFLNQTLARPLDLLDFFTLEANPPPFSRGRLPPFFRAPLSSQAGRSLFC